jgi:release factor glutamine methyltransferase
MKIKTATIGEVLNWSIKILKEHGIPNPSLDAAILLAHNLKISREALLSSKPSQPFSSHQAYPIDHYISRRCKNEPVAYLTQSKEFMGLEFHVTPCVLIPRPETELLVEEVISRARELRNPIDMLDIGTGSGCIAVSCALLIKDVRMVATDKSKKALFIAQENAKSNEVADKINFYQGDLFKALPKSWKKKGFDFILSNPPYIASTVFPKLQKDVRKYEPKIALVSGKDGLTLIKKIISQAPEYLKPNGYLLMEIGYDQGDRVKELLQKDIRYNKKSVIIKKDYANLDRIAIAQRG